MIIKSPSNTYFFPSSVSYLHLKSKIHEKRNVYPLWQTVIMLFIFSKFKNITLLFFCFTFALIAIPRPIAYGFQTDYHSRANRSDKFSLKGKKKNLIPACQTRYTTLHFGSIFILFFASLNSELSTNPLFANLCGSTVRYPLAHCRSDFEEEKEL